MYLFIVFLHWTVSSTRAGTLLSSLSHPQGQDQCLGHSKTSVILVESNEGSNKPTKLSFDKHFCLWWKNFLSFMSHIFWFPSWMYYIEVIHMVDLSYTIIWYSFSVYIALHHHFLGCFHFFFISSLLLLPTKAVGFILEPFLTTAKFHHLGVVGGTCKDKERATDPVEMHWWWAWLTHYPRDSPSIPPIPSSAVHVSWIHSSVK